MKREWKPHFPLSPLPKISSYSAAGGGGLVWKERDAREPPPPPPHPHSPSPIPDSNLTSTRLAFKFCNHAAGPHFKIFLKFPQIFGLSTTSAVLCYSGRFFAHRPTSFLREFRGTSPKHTQIRTVSRHICSWESISDNISTGFWNHVQNFAFSLLRLTK